MVRILLTSSVLFFSSLIIRSQSVGVGQWADHLSYKNVISVAEGNGKVYCTTTSGAFFMNKADNSIERMSKINGLSDVEPVVLNFNKKNNKLLIAYKNSNLDLIYNNVIINISDIKRKQMTGNKSINNIYFLDQYAYLACGFGIVVMDMDRIEIKDTYYIGPNGNAINVRDITSDGTYIYAATDKGIYRALLSSPNLANYVSWSVVSGLPTGIYNSIVSINGKIITNFSKFLTNNLTYQDTLYTYDNVSWSYFGSTPGTYTINALKNCNDQLVITRETDVTTDGINAGYYSGSDYAPGEAIKINCAVTDEKGNVWIADSKYGLVAWRPGIGYQKNNYPNGPSSINVFGMNVQDGNLWVAPGAHDSYYADGLYWSDRGEWKNVKGSASAGITLDTIKDFVNVLVDPNNSKLVYAASWGQGLLELYNGVPSKLYNTANSTLQGIPPTTLANPIRTEGLAMDASNNLWVSNNGVASCISVKKRNGSWKALNFSSIIGSAPSIEQILIDKNDQKWILLSGTSTGGLIVYNGDVNGSPTSSNTKKLTPDKGNGALPSTGIYSFAEDMDGEIWVGTDKGIAVFYSPENIFSGKDFDAEQILIEQDGHTQILLETEQIQAIAVDDANRKWIATANSGVFLMSADGTTQIQHFDESNSPLFSNNVKRIVIDRSSGEVYFGTSKGIISYRGTATEGLEDFTNVYAFPNPVKHDYDGPIAIKGLVSDATVKITDISGSIVYETKSEGGQALWYGKNFKGERVSSGVYMVFCASEDGTKKLATKILLIN